MFPIRDHNPSGGTPYVTYVLMAINIVVFLGYWSLFDDPRALNEFFYKWSMVPVLVTMEGTYHTVLTGMFLHGGFMHLAGNMLFLWIFGDNMEDEMGHVPYLLFYLTCGVAAGIAHILAGPNSQVPMIGASGAIAGVMGGYLLLFPKAKVDILVILIILVRIFPIPAWIMLAVWFALQLTNGVGADLNAGGVAYWAHTGGFIAGLVLAFPLFLRLGGPTFWQNTHGEPPHPEAQYTYAKSKIPTIKRSRDAK